MLAVFSLKGDLSETLKLEQVFTGRNLNLEISKGKLDCELYVT